MRYGDRSGLVFMCFIVCGTLAETPCIATGIAPAAANIQGEYVLVSQRKSEDVPAEVQAWRDEIQRMYSQAKYTEAVELQRRELAWTQQTLGLEHPDTAESLNNLAFLFSKQGRYSEAGLLYKRALAIREKVLGPHHPETATVLDNLAGLYLAQGRFGESEHLYKRALAIKEKTLGLDHLDTAFSLNNLAELYRAQGRYSEAQPLHKRALTIVENALGPDHPNTATILNNLAIVYYIQGRHGEAEHLHRQALEIREKALSPHHPDTASSLNNLAELYRVQGRYSEAEPLYKRALTIVEKSLRPHHTLSVKLFNNLAELYGDQGRYGEAESLHQQALTTVENALGQDHPLTATSLNNLAIQYHLQGRYAEAERLFKRALVTGAKILGHDNVFMSSTLNNMGELRRSQGRSGEAENLYRQAIAIREKVLGPHHPDTATVLANLAGLYRTQGRFGESEHVYKRVLAIAESALGPDHPLTASTLTGLAELYRAQDRLSEAKPLYKRALTIREKALGPEHPATAATLEGLAFLNREQGRYSEAQPLQKRALAIREKAFGPEHLTTAFSLNDLALLYREQGQYDMAEPLFRRGIEAQSWFLQQQLPLLPVEQRQAQLSVLRGKWELTFSDSTRSFSAAQLALFTRLNLHGLLLEIERRQGVLLHAPGPQRRQAEQLGQLTSRLSDPALPSLQRQALEQHRQGLQRDLYAELPALQPRMVETMQVAKALPDGAKFLAFQRYQPFDARRRVAQRWADPHYLALVLSRDGTTAAVELGPADSIDSLIETALTLSRTAGMPFSAVTAAWKAVHVKVFPPPLLGLLQGSRRWIVSPDGQLSRIPFLAISSLLDPSRSVPMNVAVQVVTSGRDLVPDSTRPSRPHVGLPLVLADPEFGDGGPWPRLGGSEKEGRTIAGMLQVQPRLGPQASEATVKDPENATPSVIHVASHGFFAAEEKPTEPQPASPPAGLRGALSSPFGELPPRRDDAMLNSAIILAGANRSMDNGYLYAKEVAQLQLDGTDLVVLSACETAAGEHRSGEGVYGLQRALRVAGARSTLLSLWKVDDAATAAFMERYYDKLLNQNMGKREALLEVQREFRSGQLNPVWKDWAYWAAWQLVGDTGPLQR